MNSDVIIGCICYNPNDYLYFDRLFLFEQIRPAFYLDLGLFLDLYIKPAPVSINREDYSKNESIENNNYMYKSYLVIINIS